MTQYYYRIPQLELSDSAKATPRSGNRLRASSTKSDIGCSRTPSSEKNENSYASELRTLKTPNSELRTLARSAPKTTRPLEHPARHSLRVFLHMGCRAFSYCLMAAIETERGGGSGVAFAGEPCMGSKVDSHCNAPPREPARCRLSQIRSQMSSPAGHAHQRQATLEPPPAPSRAWVVSILLLLLCILPHKVSVAHLV